MSAHINPIHVEREIKTMNDYPSRKADQVLLRLPDGWRGAIKVEAKKNHRSMNSEIIAAIETAMRIKGVHLDAAS